MGMDLDFPVIQVKWNTNAVLGRGAFGTVYAGTYGTRRIALKTIQNVTPEELMREMQLEVKIWLSLRHPNIATFWGLALNETGEPMLVIDRYEMNLLERLHRGPVPNKQQKTNWLLEIACALDHLHSFYPAVLHNDLKPDNVLLDTAENAVLTDFGLSRAQAMSSHGQKHQGHFLYAPPESFQDGYTTTTQYDIYSFGMVMYEIWTHQRPFLAYDLNNPQVIIDSVKSGERPQRVPGIPNEVWSLIRRCWSQNPNQRPKAEAICEEIRSWEEEGISPVPIPSTPAHALSQTAPIQERPEAIGPSAGISVAALAQVLETVAVAPLPTTSEDEQPASQGTLQNSNVAPQRANSSSIQPNSNQALSTASVLPSRTLPSIPVLNQPFQPESRSSNSARDVPNTSRRTVQFSNTTTMGPPSSTVSVSGLSSSSYQLHSNSGIRANAFTSGASLQSTGISILPTFTPNQNSSPLTSSSTSSHVQATVNRATPSSQTTEAETQQSTINNNIELSVLEHVLMLAVFGERDAQQVLVQFYEIGEGIHTNLSIAVKWHNANMTETELSVLEHIIMLAIFGERDAQLVLGQCYETGDGVCKDLDNAVKWYQASAESGNSEAQFRLGLCCEEGLGVQQNKGRASHLFQQAVDGGYVQAQTYLRQHEP